MIWRPTSDHCALIVTYRAKGLLLCIKDIASKSFDLLSELVDKLTTTLCQRVSHPFITGCCIWALQRKNWIWFLTYLNFWQNLISYSFNLHHFQSTPVSRTSILFCRKHYLNLPQTCVVKSHKSRTKSFLCKSWLMQNAKCSFKIAAKHLKTTLRMILSKNSFVV